MGQKHKANQKTRHRFNGGNDRHPIHTSMTAFWRGEMMRTGDGVEDGRNGLRGGDKKAPEGSVAGRDPCLQPVLSAWVCACRAHARARLVGSLQLFSRHHFAFSFSFFPFCRSVIIFLLPLQSLYPPSTNHQLLLTLHLSCV